RSTDAALVGVVYGIGVTWIPHESDSHSLRHPPEMTRSTRLTPVDSDVRVTAAVTPRAVAATAIKAMAMKIALRTKATLRLPRPANKCLGETCLPTAVEGSA